MRGPKLHATALVAAAAIFAGCGAQTHSNDPRPPVPAVISVTIDDDRINVTPQSAAEPGERNPNLNQNQNAPQVQTGNDAPLVVKVAIANLTRQDTKLVLEGPEDHVERIVKSGSASFPIALPSGTYRLSSPVSGKSARLNVDQSRVSSGGDVLIP